MLASNRYGLIDIEGVFVLRGKLCDRLRDWGVDELGGDVSGMAKRTGGQKAGGWKKERVSVQILSLVVCQFY